MFCGRRSDHIKGLLWMGDGFFLLCKRLEAGSLSWPRTSEEAADLTEEQFRQTVKNSVAYQALQKIGEFYGIDTQLKELPVTERLSQRQEKIKPLVEESFAWVKRQSADCAVPPRSQTGQGLKFILNQESYLKVFLTDGWRHPH